MNFHQFLAARANESYPEPISEGHEKITVTAIESVRDFLPADVCALDVGCGSGVAFRHFVANGIRTVIAVTTSGDFEAADSLANELNSSQRCRIYVYKTEMHEVGETWPAAFDLVWARHVLEHSVAPLFALHQFNLALKSGGILYVEVPMPGTSCHHELNPNHYSVLTAHGWKSLIERAGFDVLEAARITLTTGAGPDEYVYFICKKP